VRGLELSRRFYFEAVRPILERHFPDFEHAAAFIGYGSDVRVRTRSSKRMRRSLGATTSLA